MSNEVALSKESLQSEGIELKLTQSDIIEMLVEDQVKSITDIADNLEEEKKTINEMINKEWDNAIQKQLKNFPIPKGFIIEDYNKSNHDVERNVFATLRGYVDQRSTITYGQHTSEIVVSCKVRLTLKYRAIISKIEMFGNSEPIEFNFKLSKKLVDLVNEHSKKVKDFLDKMPAKGISEKEIAKTIKNRLTKEMIKNMNPDLQKALKKGFGVTF